MTPDYPPGSLLRAVWYDELFEPGSYAATVNDGWLDQGLDWYQSLKDLSADRNPNQNFIPYGTKGLLFVKSHYDRESHGLYCQIIWNEKLVWVPYEWLVLEKRGSE